MELTGLEGRPCAAHGNPIKVRRIAGAWRAVCVGPGGHCDTAVLTAYAASLNGHASPAANGAAEGTSGAARGIAEEQDAPVVSTEAPARDENGFRAESSSANGAGQARNGHVAQLPDVLRRVPPQNLEAEQSVLGAIFLANAAIEDARRLLKPDDFYREAHRTIFSAMCRLADVKAGIDAVTLGAALGKSKLEEIGGSAYLLELAACVPTAQHTVYYAEIVRDLRIKRDIITHTTRLASLAYDGVSADALQGEVARLLLPATTEGQRNLPNLIGREIQVFSGAEFAHRHQTVEKRHWLVEGFLARKEISLWSGKVEAGKTTLMRTLCMCVARGEMFLERHTYPSRVLYVMLDADGEDLTYEEFQRLGWNPQDDAIDFLVDPVMCLRPNSFEQFHAKLLEYRPQLVVIDPLGRFQKIDDILGYETTYAMAQFSELAKRADCHMALLHHIPRGRNDNDDVATAGFGSIAISGGCNARFGCTHKAGDIYTFKTSKGKGGGFVPFDGEQVLSRDPQTHWVTLAGPYSFKDQAHAIKTQVLEIVVNAEREMSSDAIGRELKVQRSAAGLAARMLADQGLINFKKDGKRYLFWALDDKPN